MKNISLIVNAVLVVAVAGLYIMQFSDKKSAPTQPEDSKADSTSYSVVYINSDSVLVNYEYFNVIQKQLQEKGAKLEQEYKNRATGLQREVNDFQQTVNSLTIGQAKALEEDLIKKQQNLRLYQENLSQQILKEEAKLNKELYDKVTAFLKDYSAKNNIDLVVKYNQGSDILYATDGMDVTDEVIVGLNKAYKAETSSPSKKTETDSTAVK